MKRLFVIVTVLFVSLSFLCPPTARSQVPEKPAVQAPSGVVVENIRGSVYQVKGGAGANTGFFIGEKEVVVIDAKMTEASARQMTGEIRKLTTLPISFIAITHSDQDHVNGLVGFPGGIPIISHENTRVHMDKAFQSARERSYLPNITFSQGLHLYPAGTGHHRIEFFYFGPAHTDGDAVILFSREKVAFIGDLIFTDRDQLIHRHKSGNSSGLVKVLKSILELDADLFLSGHSDPVTKAQIRDHIRTIEEKQAKIRAMVAEGRTLADVKSAFNVDDRPGGARWPSLVETIYLEETAKKQGGR